MRTVKVASWVLLIGCMLGVSSSARAGGELAGVVLVISDGTSQELITTARIYSQGVRGRLELENFPQTAVVRTYSRSDMVTDSAAAATSMGRGIKADNRVLGMAEARSESGPESLLDIAKAKGWSTGLVSDDSVTGATPAAFIVEHGNRNDHAKIAGKMVAQMGGRADIVLGGGRQWFQDDVADAESLYDIGERELASQNAESLQTRGVEVFTDWETLRGRVAKENLAGPVLGLFAANVFSYYADGLRDLRLVDLTEVAVDFLKSKQRPFFLMLEASLPDKASHGNNAKRAIFEVLELDATLRYLRESLGPDVLILVTTDHATGGLALNGYPAVWLRGDILLREDPKTRTSFLSYASGPGGYPKANTGPRIIRAPDGGLEVSREPVDPAEPLYVQPALVASGSAAHTGGDVWMLASGPGSEVVRGYLDNTDVFRIARAAIRGETFVRGDLED